MDDWSLHDFSTDYSPQCRVIQHDIIGFCPLASSEVYFYQIGQLYLEIYGTDMENERFSAENMTLCCTRFLRPQQ